MSIPKKPYLVIPFLIEQPTWGGSYICEKKGWQDRNEFADKKIGQSYELYDKTLLAATIFSTDDPLFGVAVQNTIPISTFQEARPFPLIKFTQAKGNSFQLHIKPSIIDARWKQKAESWYYLEDGKVTFGVQKGVDLNEYKKTCIEINEEMKRLSILITKNEMTLSSAQQQAMQFIHNKNPWQFVNVHEVKKGDIVDLSGGGIHHSWEEDTTHYPLGNIVYEVQQDVMDPTCTIRSFDQGKIKEDGTIREIHINDYFTFLDDDEKKNTLQTKKSTNGVLFDTSYYSLSLLSLNTNTNMKSNTSFHHLFVQEGAITVTDTNENTVTVGRGHSCFIPQGLEYTVQPHKNSEVLLTFLR